MTLTFNDGKTLDVADNSTVSQLIFTVKSYADIPDKIALFTIENMVSITLGENAISDVIPVKVNVLQTIGDDTIVVTIITRSLTSNDIITRQAKEIEELKSQLKKLSK